MCGKTSCEYDMANSKKYKTQLYQITKEYHHNTRKSKNVTGNEKIPKEIKTSGRRLGMKRWNSLN